MLDRGSWESAVLALGISPVDVQIEHEYDEISRLLTVEVKAQFRDDNEGDFRFNAYIMENDVPAPTNDPQYAQANYYHGKQQFASDPVTAPLVTAGNPCATTTTTTWFALCSADTAA